jgi:cysteine desulfuration protein SufE
MSPNQTFDAIVDDFAFLDNWDDRYRYLIELGGDLKPLSAAEHGPGNKVHGCASQVWLVCEKRGDGDPALVFRGDSDAHIVRGLIAVLLALYSGKRASEIAAVDAATQMARLDLSAHITPQRSNGVRAMIRRIREHGEAAAAAAHPAGASVGR